MSTDDRFGPGGFRLRGDASPQDEINHLYEALATRTVLGQATGMIAVSKNLSMDQAWAALVILSNLTNVRIAQLAELLIAVHNGAPAGMDDRVVLLVADRLDKAVARLQTKDQTPSHIDHVTVTGPEPGHYPSPGAA